MGKKQIHTEAGTLLIECAFVCSGLFLLFFGVFELGNAFITHTSLARVAYEGSRIASTTSGLWTAGAVCSSGPVYPVDDCYQVSGSNQVVPCPANTSDPNRIIQTAVRDALKVALPKKRAADAEPWNEVMVSSVFDPATRSVRVCLTYPVNQEVSVLSFLTTVRVSSNAPYLIRS